MAESLNAVRMTRKYKPFLDHIAPGSKIINYANKATGRDCDICHHTPEQRPPKPGYKEVSEEMVLMRVKLPVGITADQVDMGKTDFTVTGNLIELNVCKNSQACRDRAGELEDGDGNKIYPPEVLSLFR
jgi:hypothetical protein